MPVPNPPKGAKMLPNGKPNPALNAYRREAMLARADKGQITKNFNLSEFSCHDGSWVPVSAWPAIVRLATDFLEPMRTKFGACTVLSGYRHRQYNTEVVHGALNSQHIYDETPDSVAADTRYPKGSPAEWAAHGATQRTKNGGKAGIGRYDSSGFVHIDNRPYKADWKGN